jgi:diamine N-acetyltransferase
MHFEPWWECHGAFAGGPMVGFVMIGRPPAEDRWFIQRLMIGAGHQGRGLGRATLRETLRILESERGAAEVYLSFEPENTVARRLYESEGFRDTGEREEGELVFRRTAPRP